jgi:hypothetical protein
MLSHVNRDTNRIKMFGFLACTPLVSANVLTNEMNYYSAISNLQPTNVTKHGRYILEASDT